MRILHLAPGNLYGGIETGVLTFVKNPVRGLEHRVAVFHRGRLGEELASLGHPTEVLGAVRVRRPWTIPLARRRLAALLERERFDAVVTHSPWTHGIGAPIVRRARIPIVHWVHGLLDGKHWLERWASWTVPDLVVANARGTAERVSSVFPGVPVTIIHQPVAPPVVRRDRAEVRLSLETPPSAIVVVMACRVERIKGHPLLLEALATLDERYVAWIAGGPQRPSEQTYLGELERLASGRVRFLGERRDVPDLLAAADILCQPNVLPETFGIAFIEALYAGLPVVTTRMGGALEILDDTCAILIEPTAPSVANALARLGDRPDERRRLGANGPARASALCDPFVQGQALHEALTALVGVHAP